MPLVTKPFSNIITFTRASTGTFTGSNGLIQTATTNTPRFDYDPVTLAAKGLLIEEQRTNLLTYSEQFDNAAWSKVSSTVTANPVVAPDGALTADKLQATATNAYHGLDGGGGNSISFTSGTTYTISAFAKAGEYGFLRLGLPTVVFGSAFTYFNLQTGALGTRTGGVSHSIVAVGNGWYRCSFTATATATTSTGASFLYVSQSDNQASYTGDGYSGIYIWGAQLEAGAFPTSYIPTVASQVTRSADVASVNTLSPWYNASEGTIYTETQTLPNNETSAYFFAIGNAATTNNYVLMRRNTGGEMRVQVSGIAVVGGVGGLPYTAGAVNKVIGAYKVDDAAFLSNGGAVQSDSSCPVPQGLDYAGIGQMPWGTALNGHIRNVAYYPRRLSNAELQTLTA